jgi:cation transport ATPase
MRVEVARSGEGTRARAIARALVAATSPAPGATSPTPRTLAFAQRAVGPTLATAGVGFLIGDLTTVGAILRPDYATGPGVTVPLETLRNVALCARRGIVVCRHDVFERLAAVDVVVLDDDPALGRVELEVAGIHTQLAEANVLRYAASAFRHLADDRASALETACRDRRIHRLDLPAVEFGPGVTIRHNGRRIRVYESTELPGGTGPLAVEVDGVVVGLVEFVRSSRPAAAAAVRRIRSDGSIAVALVSRRAHADVAALASLLGVDTWKGSFSSDELARFLASCRDRGLRTAFVGHGRRHANAAASAHVAVSFVGEVDEYPHWADALFLQPRLELFADLWEIAHRHEDRVLDAQKFVLVPNIICVAGAFLFGFSSLAAVVISNVGTLSLFHRARGSLGQPESTRHGRGRRLNVIKQTGHGHV